MDTTFSNLLEQGKYENAIKYAFCVFGPLAEDYKTLLIVEQKIGHSYAYNSDLVTNREDHFKDAANFVALVLISNSRRAENC